MIRHILGRLATALLGPRCPLGCSERVYPRDVERHLFIDHAGDIV